MKLMYILFLVIFFDCSAQYKDYQFSQLDCNKLNDRLKSKDILKEDTLKFENFQQYCRVIPDIKLPFDGTFDSLPHYPDNVKTFLPLCNYGDKFYLPLAKIIQNDFIMIFYSVPTDGGEIDLCNYDFNGKVISGVMFNDQGPNYRTEMEELSYSYLDKELILTKIDSVFKYKIDSANKRIGVATKYQVSKNIFKINNNGKITKLK